MARLPTPGADEGVWGDVLNQYLAVEHNADGTLKKAADIQAAASAASAAQASADAAQTTADSAQTTANTALNTANTTQSNMATKADDSAVVHNSIATAKGDLLVANGNGSFTRLGVGANNRVLTADSTQPAGVKWAPTVGGITPLTWQNLNLATNAWDGYNNYSVTSFGSPYAPAQASIDDYGVVRLRGLLVISYDIVLGALLASLPSPSMYPAYKKAVGSFDANSITHSQIIIINTDGSIRVPNFVQSNYIFSLDGLSYETSV